MTAFKISSKVHSFAFEEALVVLASGSGRLGVMNPVARYVWEAIAAGDTTESTSAELANAFGIPLESVARDVAAMIAAWRREQWILTEDPAPQEALPRPSLPWTPRKGSFCDARHYAAFGNTFTIRFHGLAFDQTVHERLRHLESDSIQIPRSALTFAQENEEFIVAMDDIESFRSANKDEAGAALSQHLVEAIHPDETWAAILHGAVLGADGRCIVLPAQNQAGKSTLSAALLHAGFAYLSDDIAPLAYPSMAVAAFPTALCLREGSWPVLAERFPALHEKAVHLRHGFRVRFLPPENVEIPAALPAAALVFPRYEAVSQPSLQPLTPLEALTRLSDARVWIGDHPDHAAAFFAWLTNTPAFAIQYDALEDAVELVRRVLSQSLQPTGNLA